MDAANIDLKAFNQGFYKKLTGSELTEVLETIDFVVNETDCRVELTTLLIPNENDSMDEISKMSQWIIDHCGDSVPLHFTKYHPDYRMMNNPATPQSTLETARKIALDCGLKYVYTGNVIDPAGQATYCPNCSQKMIGRDYYEISEWHLQQGHCQQCGHPIAGVFVDQPGHWGNRRQPIRLSGY